MSAEDWHGECHKNGMSGNCGNNCSVFQSGECENVELENITMKSLLPDFDEEDALEIIQLYKDRDENLRRDRFNRANKRLNRLLGKG